MGSCCSASAKPLSSACRGPLREVCGRGALGRADPVAISAKSASSATGPLRGGRRRCLVASGVGHHGAMSDEFPLTPAEALDSDEVRNDDGDETVDPPERWIEAQATTRTSTSGSPTKSRTSAPTDIDVARRRRLGPETVSTARRRTRSPGSAACTAASAARSTGRRRTASRSTTSSSERRRATAVSSRACSTMTERASTVTFAPARYRLGLVVGVVAAV